GGGSLLPIHDAIRMAAHARHYLALFDDTDGRPLYLGRAKRIATADQRIVLHAKDIGCTYPGCSKPGYLCQTHHRTDWAADGSTDADQLTFACEPHHKLATTGRWTTTATPTHHHTPGRTQWTPPIHIDPQRKPRINHYHHPNEYLTPTDNSTASIDSG
uniref:HNH endonuclease signature motif containing protein n=1 Tax=Nocardia altamirensis TaxID=472158 RepID=UPI00114CCC69